MTEYEIQRCTRHCAVSGRELAGGETCYSALVCEGGQTRRLDYAAEAWSGPPAETVAWWKSQIPDPAARRRHWAPNDVMLEFFDQLEGLPEKQDMRCVLALLLVRRRVMRLEESEYDASGGEIMVLYCPRRDATYRVPAVAPEATRVEEIQQELAKLLE